MVTENPEALVEEESPLIAAAPAHVRLTHKQRQALIFLAFAVPLWLLLSFLTVVNRFAMLVFLAGCLLLVVIYGMRTEYLLFLWLAINVYNEAIKWMLGVQILGVGIKGLFFVAVLTQLPNKFSLMPRRLFRTVPIRWPLYLFLLWVGASIFWSDFRMYGLNRYLTWLMALLVYALVFLTIDERNKRLFFIVFAIMIGSSVLFGLLQSLGLGIAFVSEEETMARGLFLSQAGVGGGKFIFRASGLYGHPNGFGRECVYEFCVLLMMLFTWRPKPFWRGVIIGMLLLTVYMIVASMSRGAWAHFTVGAVAFVFVTRRRWLIMLGLMAVVIALIGWSPIWARIEPILSGTDASLTSREIITRAYMDKWVHQPITGYGFGSTGGGAIYEVGAAPHMGYVALLSRMGIIGLILYLIMLFSMMRHALRVIRDRLVRADPELHAMAAVGFAACAIVLVGFTTSVLIDVTSWYLIGAAFATFRIVRNRNARSQGNLIAQASGG